jgi:sulfur carrier protein
MQITLKVNGQAKICLEETKLNQFIEQLGLNPHLVVIEYNGEILHRQYWQSAILQDGDILEIVTIVGGG